MDWKQLAILLWCVGAFKAVYDLLQLYRMRRHRYNALMRARKVRKAIRAMER